LIMLRIMRNATGAGPQLMQRLFSVNDADH
jgi:hypothetical protein